MNRIEMLKEMGITPVWVPRGAVADAAAKASATAATAVMATTKAAAAPATLVPAARPASAEARPAPSDARKPLVGAVPAAHAANTGSHSASAASTSAKNVLDPERAALIARMDWPQLQQAAVQCQACTLCQSRSNTVFGSGDQQADWLIIGDAPGQEEDQQGEPFAGQAGQLLDSMLAAIDLNRGNLNRSGGVYITNVVKCSAPANRNPEPHEMAQCAPHLLRQVELIAPKVILLMGRFAVQAMLHTDASIASLRGQVHTCQGIPAVVTYHPAYLLRTLTDKARAWEDLLLARSLLCMAS